MRLFRAGRPLKRWRYVGVFCEELMACAALIQVGPARQSFWAVCSRADGRLRERTSLLPRGGTVVLEPGRLRVRDRDVLLDLSLEERSPFEARCTHGRGQVWTRKQVGVAARGTISLDGEPPREIAALAAIDDTAGYHARHTEWWWNAGVGERPDGAPLAWNLVAGVNDPPIGSERAVWVDGAPREVPPVVFTPDLSRISCPEDGSGLRFVAEAERRRHENLLIVSSDYRAPFGTFSGTLPGNIPLAHGLGVTEHHRARW
ncbi:MAG TPA: DUF2804 family protein [Solirubrobacteraceae bacterium]|jgi:hypothetical protein